MQRTKLLAVALSLTTILVPAQDRAACTGIVRDAAGAPLAGAEVVFAFESTMEAPSPSDEVVVAADDEGRFSAELRGNDLYRVWARGPARDDGSCAFAPPRAIAAATWDIEIHANTELERRRVLVSGIAPWLAEGPVSLRVGQASPPLVLAGVTAPAADWSSDVALPGDGPMALPICPTEPMAVTLVRDDGRVIQTRPWAPHEPSLAFDPPVEFRVEVVDGGGTPIEGAAIERTGHGGSLTVTDATGKATVRVALGDPEADVSLRAAMPGYRPEIAGWSHDGRSILSAVSAVRDEPLQFVLAELDVGAPRVQRVLGVDTADGDAAWYRAFEMYRVTSGAASVRHSSTLSLSKEGVLRLPSTLYPPQIRIGDCGAGVDERIVALSLHDRDAAPIDFDGLQAWRVRVAGSGGELAKHVRLGLLRVTKGRRDPWLDRCALPAGGAFTLRLPKGDFWIYAWNADAHGIARIDADAEPGDVAIELRALAMRTLHVSDANGEPVVGARFDVASLRRAARGLDPGESDLASVGTNACYGWIPELRSDGKGRLRIPLVPGLNLAGAVTLGERRSEPIALDADGVVEVVLR